MDTRQQFDKLLRERESATGFIVPELLHEYLVELLDSRLTRVDIIPDPSFGERYLLLQQTPSVSAFKDYADTCLFFTSLLPEYGQRRGLSLTTTVLWESAATILQEILLAKPAIHSWAIGFIICRSF